MVSMVDLEKHYWETVQWLVFCFFFPPTTSAQERNAGIRLDNPAIYYICHKTLFSYSPLKYYYCYEHKQNRCLYIYIMSHTCKVKSKVPLYPLGYINECQNKLNWYTHNININDSCSKISNYLFILYAFILPFW